MSKPEDKPTVTIALEPGSYVISVVGGTHPRARVWHHDGMGHLVGPGGIIRRPSLPGIFNDLIIKAEKEEGIWPG